jgi:hypothetical protein
MQWAVIPSERESPRISHPSHRARRASKLRQSNTPAISENAESTFVFRSIFDPNLLIQTSMRESQKAGSMLKLYSWKAILCCFFFSAVAISSPAQT